MAVRGLQVGGVGVLDEVQIAWGDYLLFGKLVRK
jgi:hypothetical protein